MFNVEATHLQKEIFGLYIILLLFIYIFYLYVYVF